MSDIERPGALTDARLKELEKDYEADPVNAVARHALSRHTLSNVAYVSESIRLVQPHFSLELKTMPVANQRLSGRCWIFAGLNVLREAIAKKLGIRKFELSQNYISLHDKLEKCNFALENFLQLSDREPDDRLLMFLLQDPVGDGGQWDMFVNLVCKYGVMPQDAFPETAQSNNTKESSHLAVAEIRRFAYEAHTLRKQGKSIEEIRPLKDKAMEKIYALFLNCFGVPPERFDFEYEDQKGKYHLLENLTPKSFFEAYIGDEILDYQSIINSPTEGKPFLKNYTIDHLGNVLEGRPINHLNLPMERIEELIIAQLKAGKPVWFGSDVSFFRDRQSFAWNSQSFDYPSLTGIEPSFEKGAMLDFRHSQMNHAMVIVGVDLREGKPTRWKIENSWGEDNGLSGYYVMDEGFFSRFVYQAVIDKKLLSEEERAAASKEPIHCPPWDPMGSLAD